MGPPMFRYLFIALAAGLVILILRQLVRGSRPSAARPRLPEQHMVQCSHCGTYVPEQEALEDAGRYYCSEQHRQIARSG